MHGLRMNSLTFAGLQTFPGGIVTGRGNMGMMHAVAFRARELETYVRRADCCLRWHHDRD